MTNLTCRFLQTSTIHRCVPFALPVIAALLLAPAAAQEPAAQRWLPATASKLPRWRGFNLLEKFVLGQGRKPFLEDDFRWISKLGFNFVRLPMDYRFWIVDKDWEKFDEATLREIDQAVEWGNRYGIHVMLNFHRAPGYTVAKPKEPTDLWTDPETQRVCALHWATFARRYKGIPNERLSFNLMNEPSKIDPQQYYVVAKKLVEAIRAEDPQRLVVADGYQWGQIPCLELAELKIAQATRGYAPGSLTHYMASWAGGEKYPRPTWPHYEAYGVLYAPGKAELTGPLVIEGPFPSGTLRLRVRDVCQTSKLVATADGAQIAEKLYRTGPGEGPWKKSEFKPQWKIYVCRYEEDLTIPLPNGAKQIQVSLPEGDWLELSELGFQSAQPDSREETFALDTAWGHRPEVIRFAAGSPAGTFTSNGTIQNRQWLWEKMVQPWKDAESQGIGVMVGEFGSFNKTPHDVTLRWMEDCLANWQQAGWGWALWNFRGSFGILDSGRSDVDYEDWDGHKLDRKMLELLQRY